MLETNSPTCLPELNEFGSVKPNQHPSWVGRYGTLPRGRYVLYINANGKRYAEKFKH